jgi:RNA polymerase sigma-70 factor (ECF subfamily)
MNPQKYKLLSDEHIVKIILSEKNNDLFEVLYNRYYRRVLDKSYSLLKNREVAAEAAQNIFSKAFEKLSGFKGSASFSSWLYSIAYNYCIDFLRLKKQMHYPEWNSQNDLPEIIDETDESFSYLDYDLLLELMEKIHPEEKALIVMKYSDDLSMKQISEALRITESAAKMRLKRARARLLFLYQEKTKNLN